MHRLLSCARCRSEHDRHRGDQGRGRQCCKDGNTPYTLRSPVAGPTTPEHPISRHCQNHPYQYCRASTTPFVLELNPKTTLIPLHPLQVEHAVLTHLHALKELLAVGPVAAVDNPDAAAGSPDADVGAAAFDAGAAKKVLVLLADSLGDQAGRTLVASNGGFPMLVEACRRSEGSGGEGMLEAVTALAAILDGQPDLITPPNPDSGACLLVCLLACLLCVFLRACLCIFLRACLCVFLRAHAGWMCVGCFMHVRLLYVCMDVVCMVVACVYSCCTCVCLLYVGMIVAYVYASCMCACLLCARMLVVCAHTC